MRTRKKQNCNGSKLKKTLLCLWLVFILLLFSFCVSMCAHTHAHSTHVTSRGRPGEVSFFLPTCVPWLELRSSGLASTFSCCAVLLAPNWFFEHGLPLATNLSLRLSWQAGKSHRVTCCPLPHPSHGITGMCYEAWILCGCWDQTKAPTCASVANTIPVQNPL